MSPLERAARALYDRDPLNATTALPNGKIGMGALPWDEAPRHVLDKFLGHARVVLAAIREPSHEMLEAAARIDLGPNVQAGGIEYWRAMIEAALAEV